MSLQTQIANLRQYEAAGQMELLADKGFSLTDLIDSLVASSTISGHAAIGPQAAINGEDIYGAPSTYQILNVVEELVAQVSASASVFGASVLLKINTAGAAYAAKDLNGLGGGVLVDAAAVGAIQSICGVVSNASHAGLNAIGTIYGAFFSADSNGGANLAGVVYGAYVESGKSGAGTLAGLVGLQVGLNWNNSGVITDSTGIRIQNDGGAGTLPARYTGLSIADGSVSGVIHRNIWSQGATSVNEFEGLVQVNGLLRLAGATNAFPAFKRAATVVQARLADDSDFAPLQGKLRTDANATTGLVAGDLAALTNASIVLYDGAGQAYRVPCII